MMTMIDLMFAVRLWDYNDYFCEVFFFDKKLLNLGICLSIFLLVCSHP